VRDLVETALGAVFMAGLVLAVLLLPCALIDMAAGTSLLGPVAAALLLALSAAAVLGVMVRRYSNDKSGRRSLDKKGTAGNKGNADSDHEKDWRRR
jgi:membrane protein implicated in regulation of membrane protease activity